MAARSSSEYLLRMHARTQVCLCRTGGSGPGYRQRGLTSPSTCGRNPGKKWRWRSSKRASRSCDPAAGALSSKKEANNPARCAQNCAMTGPPPPVWLPFSPALGTRGQQDGASLSRRQSGLKPNALRLRRRARPAAAAFFSCLADPPGCLGRISRRLVLEMGHFSKWTSWDLQTGSASRQWHWAVYRYSRKAPGVACLSDEWRKGSFCPEPTGHCDAGTSPFEPYVDNLAAGRSASFVVSICRWSRERYETWCVGKSPSLHAEHHGKNPIARFINMVQA